LRFGLLAAAAALIAMLVAVPSAGAASFAGGPVKLDFKPLKLKVATTDTTSKTSTGGTFQFAEGLAGTLTMTAQSSGSLKIGKTGSSITLTHGNKKKVVLKSLVEKLTAGKGQLTAKVNGTGSAIVFFDEATTNKIKIPAGFATVELQSSKMTLTTKGAAALNKAFGLKAPAKGKKDLRLKAKAAAGTVSFTAERALTISGAGGESRLLYSQAFVERLESCGITLSAVAPAQAIPADASAPKGGVILPVSGGALNAKSLLGVIQNAGGTVLDRPEANPQGKAKYNSELTNFVFNFGVTENVLTAFVKNIDNTSAVGSVSATFATNLTDAGGTLSLTNGSLNLSPVAALLLSGKDAPLGADCQIDAGTQIGSFTLNANVT
jgi:hypothetical protein